MRLKMTVIPYYQGAPWPGYKSTQIMHDTQVIQGAQAGLALCLEALERGAFSPSDLLQVKLEVTFQKVTFQKEGA